MWNPFKKAETKPKHIYKHPSEFDCIRSYIRYQKTAPEWEDYLVIADMFEAIENRIKKLESIK